LPPAGTGEAASYDATRNAAPGLRPKKSGAGRT